MILSALAKSVVALLAVAQIATAATSQRRTGSCTAQVDFTGCPTENNIALSHDCGPLAVPLDHDNPASGTLQLLISRRKASRKETPLRDFQVLRMVQQDSYLCSPWSQAADSFQTSNLCNFFGPRHGSRPVRRGRRQRNPHPPGKVAPLG
ncbi:hypothetical protein GQ53DRAFT_126613 [Thozetella sp. PMI_491]|nr:hypothetical protein GQ53DRAFT_126613 [Thozetella sp. PMI_491]